MESQRLQLLLKEVQTCIDDFKKELAGSGDYYQETLKLITVPKRLDGWGFLGLPSRSI